MYKVYADDKILYYPGDKECTISEGVVKLAVGLAGSFECLVPPVNPLYSSIKNRKTMLSVYRNGKMIFNGEVRESDRDKHKNKKVYAVGELSFLLDSIQPQHDYGVSTPTGFLNALIGIHNDQVEAKKEFADSENIVSVVANYDSSHKITDYNSTLDALRTQLVDRFGGCLRVRWYNGARHLDYVSLSDYGSNNTQGINFGENLLDYSENLTASDIVTCVIPRGARLDSNDDFEKRVDITSVTTGGKEYITAGSSVLNSFGYVWKVVVFDDITDPQVLQEAAVQWLSENQYETMRLKVTAVDLSHLDSSIDDMNLGDRIPCKAEPYGLNMTIPIQEMTLNLLHPERDTIILSATLQNKRLSISSQVGMNGESIRTATHETELKIQNVIRQEVASIMAKFAGVGGGYKIAEFDETTGLWIRDLYMDNPDKTLATNILEVSMNGIRASNAGYKPPTDPAWKLAITLDGQISASRILTGTLLATLIKAGILSDINDRFSINMETGAIYAEIFQLLTTYFEITQAGKIISRDGPANNHVERLEIEQATIKGYRNNSPVGYIDLSADTGDSSSGVSYDAVFGSNGVVRLEFGTEIDFVDKRTNTVVGYVDGNGYHGQLDDAWFPAPEIIYVNNSEGGEE